MITGIISTLLPFKKYIIYGVLALSVYLYMNHLYSKIDRLNANNIILSTSNKSKDIEINMLKIDYDSVNKKRKELQLYKNKINSTTKPKNIVEINELLKNMEQL